ncbi:type IX secretion system protein PorQ [Hymenobacter sp. DH14]|uniref:Type IX secretion system protein PorQ n=1 Tax=Hymenobacter cyanobacteriorum TaxID=2926463 RepID=A0A9X1VIZ4_9BACT|nr:type IX secretion system protein PorQ [Hymenobacter cyanobacteriorum]MCI1189063.1 type IX secretion system protein PorQ [Hymenobacter cyanobacteriorum]
MKHFSAYRLAGLGLMLGGLGLRPAAAQQLGGRTVFPFLDLPPSAHLAALGGMNPSTRTDDPSMLYGNPALLNPTMDGRLSLSYVAYVADIKQSTAAYVFNTEKLGRMGLGISYLNYGSFESYDAAGNSLGTFGVNEYTVGLSDAYTKGKFTFGATAKLAVSSIAGSRSLAGVADAGVVYKHPTADFTAGLVVKNAGYQFITYPGTDRGRLPLDVQLGATVKPEHMPVRFSLTAHHLQQWDIQYLDPNARGTLDASGQEKKPTRSFGDNLARHFTASAALVLGPGLQLRVGYNHLQRRELRLDNTSGSAGLSFGAMVKISAFQLDYTYATLQAAGSSQYITVSRSLDSLFKKKDASTTPSPPKATPDGAKTRYRKAGA